MCSCHNFASFRSVESSLPCQRATADGIPEYIEQNVNGITYKAIKVADKIYILNTTQTI